MVIKFRISENGLSQHIKKLTYPRLTVEIDPEDPDLKIKKLEVIDEKCTLTELAKSIGELRCFILKHFRRG